MPGRRGGLGDRREGGRRMCFVLVVGQIILCGFPTRSRRVLLPPLGSQYCTRTT